MVLQSAIRNPQSAIASMLNVALTGNIAAGKSTVVELFRRWGATIIDADELVRQAQAPGGEVLAAIVRRFGSDVLASDGSLDRAALRSKVMGDQAALDALNAIVHPAVRRRRDHLAREPCSRSCGGARLARRWVDPRSRCCSQRTRRPERETPASTRP